MTQGARFKRIDVEPIYRHVAEQLRELIFSGELSPGSSLPTERELSEQLGVSRTSVREALRLVQAEGIVVGTGRGTPMRIAMRDESDESLRRALSTAVRLRHAPLSDLMELRCVIEGSALELAAKRIDSVVPELLSLAEQALARLQDTSVGLREFDYRDIEFHLAIDALAGNEAISLVMSAIAGTIADKLLEALELRHADRATFDKLNREHTAIFRAVTSGNASQARNLLVRHVLDFYGGCDGDGVQTSGSHHLLQP